MKKIKCWRLDVLPPDGPPLRLRFTSPTAAREARKKCIGSSAATIRLEEIDLYETAAEWIPLQTRIESVLAKMTDDEKKVVRLVHRGEG